jgi:hypothetical protein
MAAGLLLLGKDEYPAQRLKEVVDAQETNQVVFVETYA